MEINRAKLSVMFVNLIGTDDFALNLHVKARACCHSVAKLTAVSDAL